MSDEFRGTIEPPKRGLWKQEILGSLESLLFQLCYGLRTIGGMTARINPAVRPREMPAGVTPKTNKLIITIVYHQHRAVSRQSFPHDIAHSSDQIKVSFLAFQPFARFGFYGREFFLDLAVF